MFVEHIILTFKDYNCYIILQFNNEETNFYKELETLKYWKCKEKC